MKRSLLAFCFTLPFFTFCQKDLPAEFEAIFGANYFKYAIEEMLWPAQMKFSVFLDSVSSEKGNSIHSGFGDSKLMICRVDSSITVVHSKKKSEALMEVFYEDSLILSLTRHKKELIVDERISVREQIVYKFDKNNTLKTIDLTYDEKEKLRFDLKKNTVQRNGKAPEPANEVTIMHYSGLFRRYFI